ncbi:MAG: 6-phosphofructokinase [Nitrososphaerota archaeon]|nr:6-phosphofructokinase [Nitrososphaerota archaeon]MDG6966822.1 6-phosphofructokinase [Nitrososphaerota archaeon]MDG6977982.1 6-phosphofructokinase [Nitrososphaerota archaeon]MDG7006319.1 6-phosphofructokinase [Nitrososphaerota archaeon]MDG7021015.1 6-phosphofructokinase [Nitrososphaerota archaeon]
MKIGVLTGGGDCAGLNATIRGVVAKAEEYGFEVAGIQRGWKGLIEPEAVEVSYDDVEELVGVGGTFILTSRTNPFKMEGGPEKVLKSMKKLGLDCLVAIGGNDTLGVAHKLSKMGVKVVGVPKTMDNDLSSTDYTFGFDSAVNVAMECIDRVKTTGMSHERVIVVEVMGRDAGWVAAYAGIACGAHAVLLPEKPYDIAQVCKTLKSRWDSGKRFSLVVVAEGAKPKGTGARSTRGKALDAFGNPILGGVGQTIAQEIEKRTGLETREVVLGHVVRGGNPSAFDRVLATRFGAKAAEMVKQGKFGMMVALRGNEVVPVEMGDALAQKLVDDGLAELANSFSGAR